MTALSLGSISSSGGIDVTKKRVFRSNSKLKRGQMKGYTAPSGLRPAYLKMAKMIQNQAEKDGDNELAFAATENIVEAIKTVVKRPTVQAALRRKQN
jgi:hypothetical protein